MARVCRFVLAVALGVNPGGVNAQPDEFFAHCQRPAFAEGTVIFFRAALVAVAFDSHRLARVGLQIIRHRRDFRPFRSLQRRAVKVEMNRVSLEHIGVGGYPTNIGGHGTVCRRGGVFPCDYRFHSHGEGKQLYVCHRAKCCKRSS